MKWVTLHSHIPEMMAEAPIKARRIVERTCIAVVRRAKYHSRVRTGVMRGEWEYEMLMDDEGRVYNLVRYTVFNEYGTRYMEAHPMLHPAIAETTPEFEHEVSELYDWR